MTKPQVYMLPQDEKDIEMTLVDIINILKSYPRFLTIIPLVFGLIALIALTFQTPKFEAKAKIEIGQVSRFSQFNKGTGDIQLIESLDQATIRILSPSFINKAIQNLNLDPEELSENIPLFTSSIETIPLRNTSLIEVTVLGRTKETTKRFISSIANLLISQQEEIAKPFISNLENQLKKTNDELININKDTLALQQSLIDQYKPLTAVLLQNKYTDKRELEERKSFLEEQLSNARTFPTKLFSEIEVSGPQSHNKIIVTVLAILAGLFVAVATAFMYHSLKGHLFSSKR